MIIFGSTQCKTTNGDASPTKTGLILIVNQQNMTVGSSSSHTNNLWWTGRDGEPDELPIELKNIQVFFPPQKHHTFIL